MWAAMNYRYCVVVGVSTSAEDYELRRSYSEQDIYQLESRLEEEVGQAAEFYTAVGPDGKEIILRKYLEDQAESQDQLRIGFVHQALGHLQQEFGGSHSDPVEPVHFYQQQRELLQARERQPDTDYHQRFHRLSGYPGYDQTGYDSEEDYKNRHYGGVVTGYGDQKFSNASLASRSPKHKIRTPIIEETESTVERELISRDQSGRLRPLGSSENLNLSLSDGRGEARSLLWRCSRDTLLAPGLRRMSASSTVHQRPNLLSWVTRAWSVTLMARTFCWPTLEVCCTMK